MTRTCHSQTGCYKCDQDLHETIARFVPTATPEGLHAIAVQYVVSRLACDCASVRFVQHTSASPGGRTARDDTLKAHIAVSPLVACRSGTWKTDPIDDTHFPPKEYPL